MVTSKYLRPETTGAEKPIVDGGHSHRGFGVLDARPIECGLRDRPNGHPPKLDFLLIDNLYACA